MALQEGDVGIVGVGCTAAWETMMKTTGLHFCMPDHLQSVHARLSAVISVTPG